MNEEKQRHQRRMQRHKAVVDAAVARATRQIKLLLPQKSHGHKQRLWATTRGCNTLCGLSTGIHTGHFSGIIFSFYLVSY
jgi:hypothetical protein